MSQSTHTIDIAENTALVTFAMMEELAAYSEPSLPGAYRYHLYGGFPGFCEHTARAALTLDRAFKRFNTDCWLDTVDRFAAEVIATDVRFARPSPSTTLAGIAEDTRRSALKDGFATLRTSSAAPTSICDEATCCECGSAPMRFVVQFTAKADYRTTVYAQDADEAEAIGQHLWDRHGSDGFEKIKEVAGWSALSAENICTDK